MSYRKNPLELPHGFHPLASRDSAMLMDIGVQVMNPGDKAAFYHVIMETAFIILTGEVKLYWEAHEEIMKRDSLFEESPYCLHVSRNTKVIVEAIRASEILIQQTDNDWRFTPVFYRPEDVQTDISGRGMWNGAAEHTVRTIFDFGNAPYSRMASGEVVNPPGGWSICQPPHHPQPKVCFYKFDQPQGFGASFIGDKVYQSTHNGIAEISGDIHPQAAAPGYAMWYSWMIRHLPDNPLDTTQHASVEEHGQQPDFPDPAAARKS